MKLNLNQPLEQQNESYLINLQEKISKAQKAEQLKEYFLEYIEAKIRRQKDLIISTPPEKLPVLQGIVRELINIRREIERNIKDGKQAIDDLSGVE